jgi:hypothetical protein
VRGSVGRREDVGSAAWPGERRPLPVCASQQGSPQARRWRCKSPGAVAQRVSGALGFSAPQRKPLPVAHGCHTGAGIQPPSPIDDRRGIVSWEKRAQGEHGSSTRGFAHGHLLSGPRPWHLPGSLGCGPCCQHGRPRQASTPTALLVEGACDPALAHSARGGAYGRCVGLVRCSTGRARQPPSYSSATSLRLASVSPSM